MKNKFRYLAVRLSSLVLMCPRFKQYFLRILDNFPTIKMRLKRALTQNKYQTLDYVEPGTISELSPRALRILRDIKQVLN